MSRLRVGHLQSLPLSIMAELGTRAPTPASRATIFKINFPDPPGRARAATYLEGGAFRTHYPLLILIKRR
jgi:hypothetical protein